MKQKLLNKLWLRVGMIVAIMTTALAGQAWGDTKTETFESATTSTTYNSTTTIVTNKSSCGISWEIYYGSVSTTQAITGSKSCLIRYYTADAKLGYAKTTTGITGLTNITFNAKVTNTGNKMGVWYSTDEENWTALATDVTLTTSSASQSYDIPNSSSSTTYYVKIGLTTGSTTNKKDLIIDDVVFTYTASAPAYTITAQSNNTDYGTVSLSGTTITAIPADGYRVSTTTPYTVISGTATVTQNGNTFDVSASSDCTVTINFEAKPTVSGYTVDFENDLEDYVDWEFTNAEQSTTTITAHGGTYYATTGGKSTAAFQTKEKVAYPDVLTCYISKTTGNTTSSTWYIQVSSDGSTWTDVATMSATGMSTGNWSEFTGDIKAAGYANVYVRLYYDGTTAVRTVDDISLTTYTPAAVEEPVISVTTPFTFSTTATITCVTEGATIYYSYDNSTWTEYTEGLPITSTTTIYAKAVKGSDESTVAQVTATKELATPTVEISATSFNIGETATVTTDGPAVTLTTSDATVASVSGTTVTGVAAGTATITATWSATADYSEGSEEFVVTVVDPNVQPTEVEIGLNNTLFGTSFSGSVTQANLPVSGSKDNIVVTYGDEGSNHYINDSQIRFYPSNTLEFEAPSGYVITQIVFTSAGTWAATINAGKGTYNSDSKTWTGSETSVTFTGSGSSRCDMSKATVTLGVISSVATPTFTVASGTYLETQNVKVSNYDNDYIYFYTTDGTNPDCDANLDPTGTSVIYSHSDGIDISATTTLKMIAADIDGNKSTVATAEYTFPTIYTTIAAFMEANTTGYLNLTGAQVVYIDDAKKNIYVRDASGAVDLYNKDGFTTSLTTGAILSGIIYGKYSPYKNLPEIQNIEDISVLTATSNQTVVAKVIDGTAAAIAANLCDLVKIENTEISESSSKYYVGDNSDIQLFDNFNVGYTVTTGKAVDVSGIATVYGETYELFPRFTEDIVYLETSEAVSISSSLGYSTYCSDKNLDFTAVDAIKVFYATVEGSTLSFTRIYKVAAGTGVLLVSAAGGAVAETHVPFFTGEADDVTGNVFVRGAGATVTYADNDQNYILFNGEDGIGFYKANNNTVATNRAYIHVANGSGVKGFVINLEDDATGISDLNDSKDLKDSKVIYNLAGQRMNKMQKGINIVNGKKIMK